MRLTSLTESRFSCQLPKQIRRLLVFYAALILFVFVFWKSKLFKSSPSIFDVFRRITGQASYSEGVNTPGFPRKIWQTWKIDPLNFEERDLVRARSWSTLNPSYRYEVLTDDNDIFYVETHFGPAGLNRPDIVYFYRSLTARIIKADLLRYLILYVEGGVYADIDVEALQPINNFVPFNFDKADVDLVIGIEIDEPTFADHAILGPKSKSFCNWTIMSKPRNPAILRIINNVLNWLIETARSQDVEVSKIEVNFDNILSGTGPSAFTTAILEEMRLQTNRAIDWNTFHNMTTPKLVGRILVLTVDRFAAGQGHSNSGDLYSKTALVRHHYHASLWDVRHPRYSHPAYGKVEDCNWNRQCVDTWTANTETFPGLSKEEQARLIKAHEVATKEKSDEEAKEKNLIELERLEREREDLLAKCADATGTSMAAQSTTFTYI